MKLFIFVVLAVMLVGVTAQAAEVPTSAGDKAMVFMFNGFDDLSLGGYGGNYGIGMRYYIADGTAIRAGLEFGMWSETCESDLEGYADDENNYTLYGLNAVYEKHMEGPCSSVSPYCGIGAGFAMQSDEYIYGIGSGGETSTTTYKDTGFSGFGVLGFEWAFTNCMTLGGEYELGFWKWSGETESDTVESRSQTYDKYNGSFMGFSTASVYLSVYF
ncbi:MAG: outer membrane beta-barrel protein [Candidatus Eisenbacteria sp.]|nr:outer membrane beta-barrel protein [Candidatus Eisenbacteria bacterium]